MVSVDPLPEFDYDYINYRLKQETDTTIYAYIDVRDMKWLSNYARYWTEITDPDILNGDKEATITINFPDIVESDNNGTSYFVVGGRAYFEGNT